ncbi:MAG: CvpA family protein [Roseiarcus sp.]|jgi:membrane protein required for colicin V production
MPSYLDLAVIGIILLSAVLSMVRGFTREVLAIGSWAAAAAAAYFFYPALVPYIAPYIHKEEIQKIASATVVFFVTLIVVSVLTVRISDAILDSKVGALDRSLGFVFGAVRGFLLAVVAFAIFNWLVAEKQQSDWIKTARFRPLLVQTAERVIAYLPEDAEKEIEGLWKKKAPAGAEEPPDESAAAPPTDASAPKPAPAPAPGAIAPADKQKLDSLARQPAAPTKPAPAPSPPAKP